MDKKIFIPIITVVLLGGGLFFWASQSDTEDPDVTVSDPSPTDSMDTTSVEPDTSEDIIDDEGQIDTQGYVDVNPTEASDLVNNLADMLIIDVSPNYAHGHLPNSVNYYVGDGSLDAVIPSLDPDNPYLVYCHVDSAAIAGAQALIDAGFTMVYRLEGNYSGWQDAGYPVIADLSVDPAVQQTSLDDVIGGSGTGTAYIVRGTDMLSHQVMAELPALEAGQAYEGWLVDPTTNDFFSTGTMVQTPEGGWLLEYVIYQNYDGYDFVVITLETVVDETPETHVLEGTVS